MTWVLWSDFDVADIYEVAALEMPEEALDKKMELYDVKVRVGER